MIRSSLRAAAFAAVFAPAAVPAQGFQLDGNTLVLPGPVVYETASDKIKPESGPVLDQVKAYLEAKPYVTLMRVEVHTDSSGRADANQALSERRALAVARYLIAKGVDCKRLLPVGFGQTKPIAPEDTAEGRAKNRRTGFVNAALRGKPIGGAPVDGGGIVAGDPCK